LNNTQVKNPQPDSRLSGFEKVRLSALWRFRSWLPRSTVADVRRRIRQDSEWCFEDLRVSPHRPTPLELAQWSWLELRSCVGGIWWLLRQPHILELTCGEAFQTDASGMWIAHPNTLLCMWGIENLEAEWPWVSRLGVLLFLRGFHLANGTNGAVGKLRDKDSVPFMNSSTTGKICPKNSDDDRNTAIPVRTAQPQPERGE
jgi:hypothetical protein